MTKVKKILLSFFLLSLLSSLLLTPQTASSNTPLTGHKIVIDPGHGGTDYGSTACPGYPEKQANLDIALILEKLLTPDGATTHLTRRDNDTTLSNADRYNLANSTNAEVLVSIHLNGSTNHSLDGTQGLYGKRNKDKAFTKTVHQALWKNLKNTPDFIDFGITNFASGVLLKSNMPATIQETVFISDADECQWLTDGSKNRQQQIAQALYDGLNDWFARPDDDDSSPGRKCETPPCKKNK